MSDEEMEALLAQYPGWSAIERLVAEVRAERAWRRQMEDRIKGMIELMSHEGVADG